jgi:hypothetical protein
MVKTALSRILYTLASVADSVLLCMGGSPCIVLVTGCALHSVSRKFRRIMKSIFALLFTALCLCAQTAVTTPAYPAYIVGGGASFFNPGIEGAVDVDYHVTGIYFAHMAIGNIVVRNGQLFAIFRPGAEAHVYTAPNGLVGLTLEADGGLALGAATALSSFTGGGYLWVDLCQAIKPLQKIGHCYVETGGAIVGGTVVSTNQSTPIQLSPSIKFRWGAQ